MSYSIFRFHFPRREVRSCDGGGREGIDRRPGCLALVPDLALVSGLVSGPVRPPKHAADGAAKQAGDDGREQRHQRDGEKHVGVECVHALSPSKCSCLRR